MDSVLSLRTSGSQVLRKQNAKLEFNTTFTQIYWTRKASQNMKKRTCLPSTSKPSCCPFRHCILRLQIRFDVFCDYKFVLMFSPDVPFDPGTYHWIRPIPEPQHSARDDPMDSRSYMGASPWQLGRPPRFSAVHEPCR